MTMMMYTGLYLLLKSDKSRFTDYEKRQILKNAHLTY